MIGFLLLAGWGRSSERSCFVTLQQFKLFSWTREELLSLSLVEDWLFFQKINQVWVHPYLDLLFSFIASFEFSIGIGILLLISLNARHSKWLFFGGLLLMGVTDFTTSQFLKPLFASLRPCLQDIDLRLVTGCNGTFSFPSNHATNAGAILGWLILLPSIRCWILPATLLILYSRIYLGAHFVADVAAGVLLGFVTGFFCLLIVRKILRKLDIAVRD